MLKVFIVTFVVISAVVIARGLTRVSGLTYPLWQALLSAVLFGLLVSPAVRVSPGWWPSARGLWRASYQLAGAAAFLVTASALLSWWPASAVLFASTLALAAIEEQVFRIALPLRLTQVLSEGAIPTKSAWLLGYIAAQVLFAVSHFVSREGLWATRGLVEGSRLFAAGILYANIVQRRGFWLATGVHAALNLGLRASRDVVPHRVDLTMIVLCATIGVYGLFRLSRNAGNYVMAT